ncbi:hypothetical protein PCE1_000262 [Barthelona sp. PCE]
MPAKQKEVYTIVQSTEELENELKTPGHLCFVEVYAEWAGRCEAVVPLLQQFVVTYFSNPVKFILAKDIFLEDVARDDSCPLFRFYLSGQLTTFIRGVDAPKIREVFADLVPEPIKPESPSPEPEAEAEPEPVVSEVPVEEEKVGEEGEQPEIEEESAETVEEEEEKVSDSSSQAEAIETVQSEKTESEKAESEKAESEKAESEKAESEKAESVHDMSEPEEVESPKEDEKEEKKGFFETIVDEVKDEATEEKKDIDNTVDNLLDSL